MTEDLLLHAIAADPEDLGPQLVIADVLMSRGDPRGELIVLDHRLRTGELVRNVEAIERLLLLAAEYTFPRAREPDEPTLPFVMLNELIPWQEPERYELVRNGYRYEVSYRERGYLDVNVVDLDASGFGNSDCYFVVDNGWGDDVAASTLAVLSDAIHYGTPLETLRFPFHADRLPSYPSGARRVYRLPLEFRASRRIEQDRYGLAARDYHRWMALWHSIA
jgi:uncharacterized protein (TIGR02996 family)